MSRDLPDRTPPIIGLTGTVGAGKSTVGSMLADLGCVVSDSDALARAALEDPDVRATLRARWGDRVFNVDERVRRDEVASIVFADVAERRWLESIIHPWIERERDRQFASAPRDTVALVIDAPLLLETGLDGACDHVWVVDAPREQRLERVATSRGWDDAELARRERSQWPAARKRAGADLVLDNSDDRSTLAERVTGALDKVRNVGSRHGA